MKFRVTVPIVGTCTVLVEADLWSEAADKVWGIIDDGEAEVFGDLEWEYVEELDWFEIETTEMLVESVDSE